MWQGSKGNISVITSRRLNSTSRSGLSLVEVLVVIAVLGLLAALSLSAVQRARASARRMTCQNNLRQVGLVLANVAEAIGGFPTSQAPYLRLLPGLDATALYEQILRQDFPPPSWMVPALLCPDDPIALENMTAAGTVSYYYNRGTSFEPYNGFYKDSYKDTTPGEITDGLSQTVAMTERLVRPTGTNRPSQEEMEREPRRYFWWTEFRYGKRGEESQAIDNCRNHRTTVYPQMWGVNVDAYIIHEHWILRPFSDAKFAWLLQ
jgi:prepilin-type N-terminal cleavage/methylation domain-containing protein